MGKVKLPKEVAEAVEWLIKNGYSKEWIAREHLKNPRDWCNGAVELRGLELDILLKALFIGYEVEMTPEEKLYQLYKEYEDKYLTSSKDELSQKYNLICQGIEIAVDKLGYKIGGINA
ncbi:hypothetical protein EEL30_21550 [Brevibacillus laterosporus]|uniref:Uncharacterized protein n=1 Tax=Brevibacillus laterosporus TaxID=1465 RepID=A0A518VCB1_BRELA|nr:hypothetical protein EEL30_21550 [Brevibacillus laterosporus]